MQMQLNDFLDATNKDLLIKVNNSNENMFLFKYKGSLADWSNIIIRNARGIVFHKNGDLVVRPYSKFFNYKQYSWMSNQLNSEDVAKLSHISSKEQQKYIQSLCEWPQNYKQVKIIDKLDGSLMNVAIYNNDIITTSSGSIDGTYPKYFKSALIDHFNSKELLDLFISKLNGYTACFEYINTIIDPHIVSYDKKSIVLHGIINNETGLELSFDEIDEFAKLFKFEQPIEYKNINTEEDALNLLNQLENKNVEGFIAAFEMFDGSIFRLKFKTNSYVEKHNLYSVVQQNSISLAQAQAIYKMIDEDTIDDNLSHFTLSDITLQFINAINDLRDYQIKLLKDTYQYKMQFDNFDEKIKNSKFKKEIAMDIINNYPDASRMLNLISKLSNDQLLNIDSSNLIMQSWTNAELKSIVSKFIQQSI